MLFFKYVSLPQRAGLMPPSLSHIPEAQTCPAVEMPEQIKGSQTNRLNLRGSAEAAAKRSHTEGVLCSGREQSELTARAPGKECTDRIARDVRQCDILVLNDWQ
jgi:hypothetical protein